MKSINIKRTVLILLITCVMFAASFAFAGVKASAIEPEPLDNATLVITSYSIDGGEYITPGEVFTLNITVKNTSYTQRVGNAYVTFTEPDNLIYAEYGKTAVGYLGYFKETEEKHTSLRLVASEAISTTEVLGYLTLTFADAFITHNEIVNLVQIPVSDSGIVVVDNYDATTEATTGSGNRIGVTYHNSGNTSIGDVVLHMSGSTIVPQYHELGSLTSNAVETADVYLIFTIPGSQSVDFYFTYVDSDGITHQTATQTYTFNVTTPEANEIEDVSITNNYRINKIVSVVACVVCILISGILVLVYRVNANGRKRG
ncbi:hypothetical protein SAMN02745229_01584 [Butyrivibrio fibrisolvens DSM 3071]|uniref:Uncharacterized protein n=1 Tax=Butyrivibrio fibrisolvens DSM 3071 TaxID=1121131 RepID=A0A1M5YLT2_BUTFI|nr:hypothetical protein [Butyrivibrio fibrisolvens]SHI13035.1 hypothetical protein SAMN02745229_01584 [Butyrivibrio fibrisolvens DSM 3071]